MATKKKVTPAGRAERSAKKTPATRGSTASKQASNAAPSASAATVKRTAPSRKKSAAPRTAAGKKLIIAEKPSVANDIARSLGGFTRQGDYYENPEYVLSSAIGHLLELVAPDGVEVKRGKWSFANLPVIPPHFDLKPIERTEDRLKLLTKLLKRKDVATVINACDAGREGELIFRYILQYSGVDKEVERLWLQSMTPKAIKEGFAALRTDSDMRPLADAAVCRSESDWLIGINGTRAMTAFNSKEGGFYKTTVGRVQTPTLAILVEREERIKSFVPRDYWEAHATFGAAAGEYSARWFDPNFKKDEDGERRAERIWKATDAEAIVSACQGRRGKVTEESKPSTQLSPLLFDLTSLQREANGRFGFSARTTLSLAQALYERHKVLTYPRTDARALPEDYLATVRQTMQELRNTSFGPLAGRILASEWIRPNRRIFDNTKISDHFAIIPTPQMPKTLNEAEAKIYDLVVRRFLSVFYPAAEYLQTTRITDVAGHQYKTEGKVLVNPGWLEVYGRAAQGQEDNLPAVAKNELVTTIRLEAQPQQTRPPPRYTEATLLSAMEGAGKLVEDEELRQAMSEKGMGTPATRASIIEGLLKEEYIHRNQRELVPTPKAFSLLFALRHFGIEELRSPELTGDWEFKLKQMEKGKLGRDEFMHHITSLTQDIVQRIKGGDIPDTAYATVPSPCPRCGGQVVENYRKFQCQKCDLSIWKVVSGREFSPEEIADLFVNRSVGPLQGFRSRTGKPFAALVRLNDEFRTEFAFGQGVSGEQPSVDFTGQEPLGACPKCGGNVFEMPMAYVCENSVGEARTCDFRSGKIILQKTMSRDQMQRLLSSGKTELLHRFISKKGRPFSAYLVKKPDGNIGFEFEVREKKTVATKRKPKAATG